MSRKTVSRTFSSFSISVVAVAVASTFSAHAGKFNPKFPEDVQGVGQHVDLTMFEKGQNSSYPASIVFLFTSMNREWKPAHWNLKRPQKHSAKRWGNPLCLALAGRNWQRWACALKAFRPSIWCLPKPAYRLTKSFPVPQAISTSVNKNWY